ncbi:hypothetical protein [Paenibacillus tarimensis]|uniref:hypothetical protein n=1 Tax=Paenibacillus tarimensis TaxID=416012 RepID=UPI001F3299A6|nr:hypothetical protein [Paenibacillus tarimensis]MCF2944422.1 hypothetical protein [Paenibacillus tarimensis]
MGKTIEVFTDSARFPDLEKQVRAYACPRCSITVYDASRPDADGLMNIKTSEYGIAELPAVMMNGRLMPLEKLNKASVLSKLFHR